MAEVALGATKNLVLRQLQVPPHFESTHLFFFSSHRRITLSTFTGLLRSLLKARCSPCCECICFYYLHNTYTYIAKDRDYFTTSDFQHLTTRTTINSTGYTILQEHSQENSIGHCRCFCFVLVAATSGPYYPRITSHHQEILHFPTRCSCARIHQVSILQSPLDLFTLHAYQGP